jgi:hypothetical protein
MSMMSSHGSQRRPRQQATPKFRRPSDISENPDQAAARRLWRSLLTPLIHQAFSIERALPWAMARFLRFEMRDVVRRSCEMIAASIHWALSVFVVVTGIGSSPALDAAGTNRQGGIVVKGP